MAARSGYARFTSGEHFVTTPEQSDEIERYAKANGISKGEAIRQLIAAGLTATGR